MTHQDPKYDFQLGRIINRATGKEIPLDEPVFVLRASNRDHRAALLKYVDLLWCRPRERVEVRAAYGGFLAFARAHPDRMKEPDTGEAGE